jgi:carbamoylphosphate synthase large subunit
MMYQRFVADVYNDIGEVLGMQDKFEESIDVLIKSLEIDEKTIDNVHAGVVEWMAEVHRNMSVLLRKQGNFYASL